MQLFAYLKNIIDLYTLYFKNYYFVVFYLLRNSNICHHDWLLSFVKLFKYC